MKDQYWNIKFTHKQKGSGKDKSYIIAERQENSVGVLEKALSKLKSEGAEMSGEFRIYVYKM